MNVHSLHHHPDTPSSLVEKISCSVVALDNGDLQLSYHLEGDLQRLLIPKLTSSDSKDNLWKHSCFEAFIAVEGDTAYREYNFSPSSQWAVYAFSDYRVKLDWEASQSPTIKRKQQDKQLTIVATLPTSCLPDNPQNKPLRIGLSAIIEASDGAISYWALKHPSDTPDFHHRESFCLQANTSTQSKFMKFGIDCFIEDASLRKPLSGKRVALLAHPASVTQDLTHSLDAIAELDDIQLSAAFGPQHGLRGDKQDNMMESPDYIDPQHGIPIFSLYGEVRYPTDEMMDTFDTILIDLQDLGCRIYTFITTLRYVLEVAAKKGKAVWILDRPNPAGRPIEGLSLHTGWESFVGAGAMPMRHGLTMGELANWFVATLKLDVECNVITMKGWQPNSTPGYGWPLGERTWINPSPNAPNLWMARCYAGTVMLEGTTLSEGRGTTRPLELFGAPDIDAKKVIKKMQELAPQWLQGCHLGEIWFEPTFHKYQEELCSGVQIYVEDNRYQHEDFKPWRLQALAFKAIRLLYPNYELWRDFPYEYEFGKLAIDVINGSTLLREWVDNNEATVDDLEALASKDEKTWKREVQDFMLYH